MGNVVSLPELYLFSWLWLMLADTPMAVGDLRWVADDIEAGGVIAGAESPVEDVNFPVDAVLL